MRRNTLNFIIDLVTLCGMLAMIGTGLVIRYALPPGSGGRGGGPRLELWGLGRHDWGDMHFWLAVALAGLFVTHVALHWKWVCGTLRRLLHPGVESTDKPSDWAQHLWGLGFIGAMVLLVGGFVWLGKANVVTAPGDTGNGRNHPRDVEAVMSAPTAAKGHLGGGGRGHDGQRFRGSMTLREAAEEAGVSIDRLREFLSLPSDTPANERLGRLGRQRGVDMQNVRVLLEQYPNERVRRELIGTATQTEANR